MEEPFLDGQAPARTSKAAVASLVLSFLPFCGSFPALILSIVALVQIDRSGGRLGGRGLAIAGLVLSLVLPLVALPVLGIVLAIALPSFIVQKQRANEVHARAVLRSLASAQEIFRTQAAVDQDADGLGEYGFLEELAGRVPARGGRTDALVTGEGWEWPGDGNLRTHGYTIAVYLTGAGTFRTQAGPPAGAGEIDAQETAWCAVAWPESPTAGRRAFCVTHEGVVHENDAQMLGLVGRGSADPTRAVAIASANGVPRIAEVRTDQGWTPSGN